MKPKLLTTLQDFVRLFSSDVLAGVTHGLIYADYWTTLATPEGGMSLQYSEDGVHPNAPGYDAMQPIAARAIKAALNRLASKWPTRGNSRCGFRRF